MYFAYLCPDYFCLSIFSSSSSFWPQRIWHNLGPFHNPNALVLQASGLGSSLDGTVDATANAAATIAAAALVSRQQQQQQQQQYQNLSQSLMNSGSAFISLACASREPYWFIYSNVCKIFCLCFMEFKTGLSNMNLFCVTFSNKRTNKQKRKCDLQKNNIQFDYLTEITCKLQNSNHYWGYKNKHIKTNSDHFQFSTGYKIPRAWVTNLGFDIVGWKLRSRLPYVQSPVGIRWLSYCLIYLSTSSIKRTYQFWQAHGPTPDLWSFHRTMWKTRSKTRMLKSDQSVK